MSGPVDLTKGPAGDQLRLARRTVLAIVAGTGGSPELPSVKVDAPLRPVTPQIEAKLASGARLGFGERRAVSAAGKWRSSQGWKGPLAYCSERSLVVAATDAVERIAASRGWRSQDLAGHRARLDLVAELDRIDDECFAVAAARYEAAAGGLPVAAHDTPAIEAMWERAVTRVAALTCYAEGLDGMAARQQRTVERTSTNSLAFDQTNTSEIAVLQFFLGAAMFPDGDGMF